MYAIRIVLLSPHPPSVTGSLAYTPTLSRPLGKRKACYKRAVEKLGHAPSRIGPSLRKEARRRSGSLWRKLTCTNADMAIEKANETVERYLQFYLLRRNDDYSEEEIASKLGFGSSQALYQQLRAAHP